MLDAIRRVIHGVIHQAVLAEKVGLSEQAIRMYELGKREPSDAVIEQISDALEIAPESLRRIKIASAREALELLFALDEKFGLTPKVSKSGISLVLDEITPASQKFVLAIQAWADKQKELKKGEITQAEYDAWKAAFRG